MEVIVTKKCTKCGEEKSADEFYSYCKQCKKCVCERTRAYRKTHPEVYRALSNKYYHANQPVVAAKRKTKRAKYTQYQREWYARNREDYRFRSMRYLYGVSVIEYQAMYDKQGGKCAICGQREEDVPRQRLAIDHNHATRKVRGLLCDNCNRALGMMKDEPNRLRAAALYLEQRK